MSLIRKTKDKAKNFSRKIWEISQRIGLDILPQHYYSNLPNLKELKKEKEWLKPHSMYGINGIEITKQLAFASRCCTRKYLQDRMKNQNIYFNACSINKAEGFGPIEADFLFCFIFTKKPKRIIQIGCGVSTAVILEASSLANYKPRIICIEPYPNKFLKNAVMQHKITLLAKKVQKVPLKIIANLEEGDLLFIDSTHMVKPGSEVALIITEILPRLQRGVYIHFHDITFPYDYPRHLLNKDLFFPNESIMLHAFLINNPNFTIKTSLSMLHYTRQPEMKKMLPNYKPGSDEFGLEKTQGHYPSSIFLQVT